MASSDPLPDFVRRLDLPGPVARAIASLHLYAIDAGLTRRTPLRTHVVVCGFPLAGTTLLALMLQAAYPQARAFPKERAALRLAYKTNRNHALMISKRPDDVFYLDALRRVYRRRRAGIRFVLMMRDPRSVLTSFHAAAAGRYYVSPERWRAIHARVWRNRGSDDCLLVRFEDLVTRIADVQQAVGRFIGTEATLPFADFAGHVPPGFRRTALNGVRSLDPATIGRWREPRHRERIATLLGELPELPDVLIDMGYEPDAAWTHAYTTLEAAHA